MENEQNRHFKDYGIKSLMTGIVVFTLVNITLAVMMEPVFGFKAITGIFFIVENLFVIMLITNRNYENIMYLKDEVNRLKKELKKMNNKFKKG